jgi:outer membrane protein OmpA-like peptidoglycan-associated protein/opacity protein-like surface antigen
MRKLAITVALASTALATPAVARDKSAYVGIDGGVMLLNDVDYDFDNGVDPVLLGAVSTHHKAGWDVDARIGYDFGLVRVEGELGYKRASVKNGVLLNSLIDFPVNNAPYTVDVGGSDRALSAMVNALVDFGDENGWSGSVGGGVGIASVRSRVNVDLTANDPADNDYVDYYDGSLSGKDSSFAYQVLAEVRHPLSANIDLGLKYRFFSTRTLDFDTDAGNFAGKFRSHSLLASLTYNFAAPPPPPPAPIPEPVAPPPPATQTCPDGSVILATETCPAPAPVAVGPFIVFFDWDKDDITPEAAAILDNAAAAYAQTGSAQVMLAGHADRSGSDSYNVGLSQRRANKVRSYLAGRGVADGAITTQAFGESRPLVQTEDGVREPQNRRVEITFGPGSGMYGGRTGARAGPTTFKHAARGRPRAVFLRVVRSRE